MGKKKDSKQIKELIDQYGPGPLLAGLFAGAKPVQEPEVKMGLLDRLLAAAPPGSEAENHPLHPIMLRLRELRDKAIEEHRKNCPECNHDEAQGEESDAFMGLGMQLRVKKETAEYLNRTQNVAFLQAAARYLDALVLATRGDKAAKLKMVEFVQGLLAAKSLDVQEAMENMEQQAATDPAPVEPEGKAPEPSPTI